MELDWLNSQQEPEEDRSIRSRIGLNRIRMAQNNANARKERNVKTRNTIRKKYMEPGLKLRMQLGRAEGMTEADRGLVSAENLNFRDLILRW
jgi:hypothetical protein